MLKGNTNQCPTCNEYFYSNHAFTKHRTGQHGVNRRCKTQEEMLAAGMRLNKRGFWTHGVLPEHLKEKYGRNTTEES